MNSNIYIRTNIVIIMKIVDFLYGIFCFLCSGSDLCWSTVLPAGLPLESLSVHWADLVLHSVFLRDRSVNEYLHHVK